MIIEDNIFKKARADFIKIEAYGFIKQADGWVYKKNFMDGEFACVVKINNKGKVFGAVYDNDNNEEYLPIRTGNLTGGFASKVKMAYEDILDDILKKCFNEKYFISNQANRICDSIYQKYNAAPDFPWKDQKTASDAAVFRKEAKGKWFALIMNIKKDRLALKTKGNIDIINLKLESDEIKTLIEKDGFYPAYHMNKKYWITLVLDETLSDDEIIMHINKSYKNVR